MKRGSVFGWVAAGLALVAGWVWLALEPAPSPAANATHRYSREGWNTLRHLREPRRHPDETPRHPREGGDPGLPSLPEATSSPSVSHRLQQELMAARDWRAFALQALSRPEEGGLFYAGYVIHVCSPDSVRSINDFAYHAQATDVAVTGTLNPRIAAAADTVAARCGAFAPGETMQLLHEVKAREGEGKDPLVAAQRAALQASYGPSPEKAKVRAAAERLLDLGDPLLLSEVEVLQMLAIADARPAEGLVFDGRVVPQAAGVGLTKASLAMHLGVCRDGAPCAVEDDLRRACAVARNCRDRFEYARLLLEQAGGDDAAFSEMLQMAERVRDAVARRDVRFFVRQ